MHRQQHQESTNAFTTGICSSSPYLILNHREKLEKQQEMTTHMLLLFQASWKLSTRSARISLPFPLYRKMTKRNLPDIFMNSERLVEAARCLLVFLLSGKLGATRVSSPVRCSTKSWVFFTPREECRGRRRKKEEMVVKTLLICLSYFLGTSIASRYLSTETS